MKKFTTSFWALLLLASTLLVACQKELSFEGAGLGGVAEGVLTDLSGACQDADIRGEYVVDQAMGDSNYAIINVTFTKQGKYKIFTDTVNGIWFIDSGFALTTGATKIKLKAYGKPILPNTVDLALTFGSSVCSFPVSATLTGSAGSNTDYFPNTTNSTWTYELLPTTSPGTDTFRITVTDETSLVDNNLFKKFALTPGNDPYYFSKDNLGNYFAYSTIDFDYTYIFDDPPTSYISYIFLKDNVPVGTTWETQELGGLKLNGQSGVAKASFAIMGKDVTHAVLGTTYSNVINVKRTILFKPDGGTSFVTVLEGNSYYAKGFGLVDQVFVISGSTQSMSLIKKQIF